LIVVYVIVLPPYLSVQINPSETVQQMSLFLHYSPENSIFVARKNYERSHFVIFSVSFLVRKRSSEKKAMLSASLLLV